MPNLRPPQVKGKEDIYDSFKNGCRAVLYSMATGGGKTQLTTDIAIECAAMNMSVLYLAHRIELIRQPSAKLNEFNQRHGIINANYTPSFHHLIQVASTQTVIKRLDKITPPKLIVIDEAHHCRKGNTWGKILDAFPDAWKLGVTATPIRSDGIGLGIDAGGYFEQLVEGPQEGELMADGWLTRAKVFAPARKLDFSNVDITEKGELDSKQVLSIVDKPTITGDAVEHYHRICPGVPALVFCRSIEHAEHVSDAFRSAGYSSEYVDGKMPDHVRNKRMKGLTDGSVQVLVTCQLIDEGTDIPSVVCLILLDPTASTGRHRQRIGRGLRPMFSPFMPIDTVEQRLRSIELSVKPFAIILDHVGNVLMHGLPDENREWSLEGRKKQTRKSLNEQAAKIKTVQCPKCYMIHEPLPVCPNTFPEVCGHVYEIKPREIKKQEGELIEITSVERDKIKKEKRMEVGRAKTLQDLLAIQAERNYKSGWAYHMWEMKKRRGQVIVPEVPVIDFIV